MNRFSDRTMPSSHKSEAFGLSAAKPKYRVSSASICLGSIAPIQTLLNKLTCDWLVFEKHAVHSSHDTGDMTSKHNAKLCCSVLKVHLFECISTLSDRPKAFGAVAKLTRLVSGQATVEVNARYYKIIRRSLETTSNEDCPLRGILSSLSHLVGFLLPWHVDSDSDTSYRANCLEPGGDAVLIRPHRMTCERQEGEREKRKPELQPSQNTHSHSQPSRFCEAS